MTPPNTLFLRLEGPLQAWGRESKFVVRRTAEAPTKSGVLGMICCALGVPRKEASQTPIPRVQLRCLADRIFAEDDHGMRLIPGARGPTILGLLNTLRMAVRIDRAGTVWSDYHTVGAKIGILRADGEGIKRTASTGDIETLVTRRYYLCDASFLVALQGDPELVKEVAEALRNPFWPVYLGRKCCPPAVPVVAGDDANDLGSFPDLACALNSPPWRPRLRGDDRPPKGKLPCLIEWRAASQTDTACADAKVWHDAPVSFDPPVHQPRLVRRGTVSVRVGGALQRHTSRPPRPWPNYNNKEYKKGRSERLVQADHHLCVFCKAEAKTVQHITYRHVGTDREEDDLRSLCRLCHDAVTMIEYGLNMGLDRINPEQPRWREAIIAKREQIIRFRSMQTRRRQLRRGLQPEEVE